MINLYKIIRIKLKMNQEKFAQILGTTVGTINRWENNKTIPTKMAQLQLARLCNDNRIELMYEISQNYSENDANIFYHASKNGIVADIMPCSRSQCDFGKGFYMGTTVLQPLTLVCSEAEPIFYKIKFDQSGLRVLDLPLDLDWALFIAYNRGYMEKFKNSKLYDYYSKKTEGYDVISGFIADDKIYSILTLFFDEKITDVALVKCLHALDLGKQVVPISERACKQLEIVYEKKLDDFEKTILEDENYRLKYQSKIITNNLLKQYRREGKYFDEIMEEGRLC